MSESELLKQYLKSLTPKQFAAYELSQRLLGDTFSLKKSNGFLNCCLLYTSPSPRDGLLSRMPSSA